MHKFVFGVIFVRVLCECVCVCMDPSINLLMRFGKVCQGANSYNTELVNLYTAMCALVARMPIPSKCHI